MDLTTERASVLKPAATQPASTAKAAPIHPTSPPLPDKPLIVIEPGKSWVALGLRELWEYRELLYFLTWRDVKVRYKQTAYSSIPSSIEAL